MCPKNFSITPTAVLVDVGREVRALRRQLRRRLAITSLAERIDSDAQQNGFNFDHLVADIEAAPPGTTVEQQAVRQLVDQLPFNYLPECLAACDLARHCRSCSVTADQPSRLGGDVASLLGAVGTVATALDLINGAPPSPDQTELAELLRATKQAIDDAVGTGP